MRIATFFMVWGLLQVSAKTSAQLISLSGKNLPLMDVLKEIRQQSGYDFIFAASALEHARPVSMDIRELPLKEALRQVFAHQPLSYDITDRSVTVWMNAETGASRPDVARRAPGVKKTPPEGMVLAYPIVRGRVVDSVGQPLVGASVRVINVQGKRTTLQTKADRDGYFELRNVPDDARLEITFVGYIKQELKTKPDMGAITLKLVPSALEEVEVVVSTGYQQLPKERATGSFSYIDNKTFNQQVGTTILERLEAVGNGIVVDRTYGSDPVIMVRGLSTIEGPREPLVVVDNFPYEGDINNINPNDVESITILKDAAAASIWGARAGNGVIIIVTKKGNYDQPLSINLNANITVGAKPDLYKTSQVSSAGFVEYEKYLYGMGYYDSKINRNPSVDILSPVVELLLLRDKATTAGDKAIIDQQIESYKQIDIRDDMMKYLYHNMVNQQYALSMRGGNGNFAWNASANYDANKDRLQEKYNRINLQYRQSFRPLPNLDIQSSIYFTQSNSKNGGEGYGEVTTINNGFFPYMRLVDDQG
ncbi:MAG TPA: TonB-dependent receptor plug domain-containing protein, partial [Parapedobacter sp.]|nr:TonB-dependent receptor plug domain-containing protein [Parapedobacter sp.]